MFSRNNYIVCKLEYRTGTRTIEYRAYGMDNVRCVVVVTVYEVVAQHLTGKYQLSPILSLTYSLHQPKFIDSSAQGTLFGGQKRPVLPIID